MPSLIYEFKAIKKIFENVTKTMYICEIIMYNHYIIEGRYFDDR